MNEAWARAAESSFVSLGTYRRNGQRVDVPVWIAADGEALVVTTEVNTGKMKRLRRDTRVRMVPCSRFGTVDPDAAIAEGVAQIVEQGPEFDSANRALGAKYGFQFRAFLAVERLVRRLRRQNGRRLILRITTA